MEWSQSHTNLQSPEKMDWWSKFGANGWSIKELKGNYLLTLRFIKPTGVAKLCNNISEPCRGHEFPLSVTTKSRWIYSNGTNLANFLLYWPTFQTPSMIYFLKDNKPLQWIYFLKNNKSGTFSWYYWRLFWCLEKQIEVCLFLFLTQQLRLHLPQSSLHNQCDCQLHLGSCPEHG